MFSLFSKPTFKNPKTEKIWKNFLDKQGGKIDRQVTTEFMEHSVSQFDKEIIQLKSLGLANDDNTTAELIKGIIEKKYGMGLIGESYRPYDLTNFHEALRRVHLVHLLSDSYDIKSSGLSTGKFYKLINGNTIFKKYYSEGVVDEKGYVFNANFETAYKSYLKTEYEINVSSELPIKIREQVFSFSKVTTATQGLGITRQSSITDVENRFISIANTTEFIYEMEKLIS